MITFEHERLHRAIAEHSVRDGTAYYAGSGIFAEETLRLLCRLNRYVLVNLPRRCEPLVRRIERETGASVMMYPSSARIKCARLAVLDAPLDGVELAEGCVVLITREM